MRTRRRKGTKSGGGRDKMATPKARQGGRVQGAEPIEPQREVETKPSTQKGEGSLHKDPASG